MSRLLNRLYRLADTALNAITMAFLALYALPQFFLSIDIYPANTNSVFNIAGIVLIFAGILAIVWCTAVWLVFTGNFPEPFMPTSKLTLYGLYTIVRHPILLAFHSILFGEVILYQSVSLLIWFVIWLRLSHLYIIHIKEPLIIYSNYDDSDYWTKPRWFPKLRK